MVTLKEALTKSSKELEELKKQMQDKAEKSGLNAYIDFSDWHVDDVDEFESDLVNFAKKELQ